MNPVSLERQRGINRQTASLILTALKSCLSQPEIPISQIPAVTPGPTVPPLPRLVNGCHETAALFAEYSAGYGESAASFTRQVIHFPIHFYSRISAGRSNVKWAVIHLFQKYCVHDYREGFFGGKDEVRWWGMKSLISCVLAALTCPRCAAQRGTRETKKVWPVTSS